VYICVYRAIQVANSLQRIAEIIKRRNKQRMARAASLARKEAAGDFSHLKNKKGEFTQKPMPQPTLPNVSLDDEDFNDTMSMRSRGLAGSTLAGDHYYADNKSAIVDYPTISAYNQPYSHHQDPNNAYAHYNPSAPSLADEYPDEYGSTAALPTVGYGHQTDPSYQSSAYVADPYDVYSGHTDHGNASLHPQAAYTTAPSYRSPSPSGYGVAPSYRSPSPAAYDHTYYNYGGNGAGNGGQTFHAV
jgi:hypothetical protein